MTNRQHILEATDKELILLIQGLPYDRIGHSQEMDFVLGLYPNEKQPDLTMFIPIPIDIVKEFYIRQICGTENDSSYSLL